MDQILNFALRANAQNVLRNGAIIFGFISMMTPAFRFFTDLDRHRDLINLGSQNNQDTFDFIIVGAGSSGSSLAARLSEKYSVLVLEAGGAPAPVHSLPILSYLQFNDPTVDWGYSTLPQKKACFGLNNNTSVWPAGKVLGGSSQLNAMIYIRGNVQGFDEIAEKTGDKRWKLSNVLKYYKRLEDYNGWFDKDLHGKGGPLSVERPFLAKFTDNFMRAGEELGYSFRDPNPDGPNTEGFAKMDLYMKNGRRSDAYSEFLRPALQHSNNLIVRKFSHVTRVLFQNTNEAYGVEYLRHGQRFVAKAKMEVVLSAGAIKTPQILMLSGIGPKNHLREHGIRTRMNLPVGQYLQDKYGSLIGPFLVDSGKGIVLARDLSLASFANWISSGSGRLRTSLGEGTYSVFSDTNRPSHLRKPDIHTYLLSVSMPSEISGILGRAYNLKPKILQHFANGAKSDSFFQLVTINSQIGKGEVLLRDSNPLSLPIINPKYLQNDEDTKVLLEGVKLAVKLVENTTAMQEINGRLMDGHVPGCEAFPFKSDQYFECYLRHVTITAFKFSGTAPIGKGLSDKDAVVDSHLRVLGTKRLRVVDASVLQQKHVSINDVTCRMLGQLAADIIFDNI